MGLFQRKLTSTPITVSLSVTTARSTQLTPGVYEAWCASACFLLQGNSAVDATLTSHPIGANERTYISVTPPGDDYIAGILAASTATLFLSKVG